MVHHPKSKMDIYAGIFFHCVCIANMDTRLGES
jgi:hypothetical protein